jgi:hypothetical protein
VGNYSHKNASRAATRKIEILYIFIYISHRSSAKIGTSTVL